MSSTKFSVLQSVYRRDNPQFLAQSLQSIAENTRQPSQIILVKDGALTPESARIVADFAARDSRIKLLRTERCTGFPATPRNAGIAAASGRYIAFLDCDDEWLPTKLEHQLPLFAARNVAVVFSWYSKMGADGALWNSVIKSPTVVGYRRLLRGDCIGNLTGMYDTQKVGKVYQKEIHHEDYLMWLEILRTGFVALNTNTCEAFYRVEQAHSDSGNKFKAMRWQWHILRHELKLPLVAAARYFVVYAIGGIIKKLRKDFYS